MVQYKSIGLILGASFALWISRSSLKMELNSKLWKFLFVAVFILDIFGKNNIFVVNFGEKITSSCWNQIRIVSNNLLIIMVESMDIGDTQFRINAADEKDCYFCEPTTGSKDCMEEPTKSKTCKSKGGFCYMHISDEGVFRRGCVDAGDRFVQKPEDCSNSEKCTVCSDKANCNDKVMKEEKCVVSKYDVDKPTLPSDKPSIICRLALEQLGCYHLEQKSQVEKGCMSSLNKQKRDECKRNNNCEICTSTNCNSKVVRHRDCIQCDDATKANCADPSEAKNVTDCSRFSNSCVVGIDDKGFTHRLCGSNETHNKDRFKNGFEQCNTNDTCNINIFPQDRLKCFQCKSPKFILNKWKFANFAIFLRPRDRRVQFKGIRCEG